MEQGKNRVELIGTSGPIYESKLKDNGSMLVRWSIFCLEHMHELFDEKGILEELQQHRLCATGKTAEFVKRHLDPGQRMAIEGRLLTRMYQDENDNLKEMTEVWVQDILLLTNDNSSDLDMKPDAW